MSAGTSAPSPAPERVLEVQDLRVSYGAIEALKGVSIHLDAGGLQGLGLEGEASPERVASRARWAAWRP